MQKKRSLIEKEIKGSRRKVEITEEKNAGRNGKGETDLIFSSTSLLFSPPISTLNTV